VLQKPNAFLVFSQPPFDTHNLRMPENHKCLSMLRKRVLENDRSCTWNTL